MYFSLVTLLGAFSLLTASTLFQVPASPDKQAVEAVVRQFVQGDDERNETLLQAAPHPEHRVLLCRFNGDPGRRAPHCVFQPASKPHSDA